MKFIIKGQSLNNQLYNFSKAEITNVNFEMLNDLVEVYFKIGETNYSDYWKIRQVEVVNEDS